ncbi:MarR family transcriptional regulator [Halogranum gelatinilyticum]|uniref:MarR family transcriptional regulator n=1 Tax=Halogranum gelatinilyticum TaxID=660521 RepID=UPI001FCD7B6B|nr:helix-turn-helix domain-containing protein [Halogranum gelatinilyticum]
MPVDFENYQPSDLPGANTNGRKILRFLAASPETGYRAGEIAEALELPRGSVGTTLGRLHDQGFVRLRASIGQSILMRTTHTQRV